MKKIKRLSLFLLQTMLFLAIEYWIFFTLIPFFWKHQSSAAFNFCVFLVFVGLISGLIGLSFLFGSSDNKNDN